MSKPISPNSPYSPDFSTSTPPIRSGVYIRQPSTSFTAHKSFAYFSIITQKWYKIGQTPLAAYNNFQAATVSNYQHNGTWRGLKAEDYNILANAINWKLPITHPLLRLIYGYK